jgi:hypothetical protein
MGEIKVDFSEPGDIRKMLDLEAEIFPADGLVSQDLFEAAYKNNPLQFMSAKDSSDYLWGYICSYPITRELEQKMLIGSFEPDEHLQEGSTVKFEDGAEINCYVGIVVRNERTDVAAQLLFSMVKYARVLMRKNIKIRKLYAVTYSPEGKLLCKKMGFRHKLDLSPFANGFLPQLYVLDMKEDNNSMLIRKIQRLYSIK